MISFVNPVRFNGFTKKTLNDFTDRLGSQLAAQLSGGQARQVGKAIVTAAATAAAAAVDVLLLSILVWCLLGYLFA